MTTKYYGVVTLITSLLQTSSASLTLSKPCQRRDHMTEVYPGNASSARVYHYCQKLQT